MTDIYITLSTSVLSVSAVPQVVLLSTLYAPGSVFTIRDNTGSASSANPITISTTLDNLFYDGTSSTKITQPFGYLSITPKQSTIWTVQNTFAFPEQQAAATVQSLTAGLVNVSSMTVNSVQISSLAVDRIVASTISTFSDVSVRGNLTVSSNVNVLGQLTTQSFSTLGNFTITGSLSTISSLAVGGNLTVALSTILERNLLVNGSTIANASLTVRGGLVATNLALFQSNVSCLGSFTVLGSTLFQGPVLAQTFVNLTSSLSVTGSISTGSNFTVAQRLTTSSLTVLGQGTISSLFIQSGGVIQSATVSTISSMTVGSNLTVSASTITNSLFVTANATFSTLRIISSLGVNCNLPSYNLDINGSINATNYFQNGQPLFSNIYSTITASTVTINTSLTLNSAFLGGVFPSVQASWNALDTSQFWQSIATSANGQYVVAPISGGQIKVSSNFGSTWASRDSSRSWTAVACAYTGQFMTATVTGGHVYVSVDYGTNWVSKVNNQTWTSVTMSSNGKYQSATISGGDIAISSNYGNNWSSSSAPSLNWTGIAMNYEGDIQYATAGTGTSNGIWKSTDYGSNWSRIDTTSALVAIATSGTGEFVTAVQQPGFIFTSSDAGATFTQRDSSRSWSAVAVSYTGQYQLAANSNSNIFFSSNYGSNWSSHDSARLWTGVAMSSNGQILYGSVNNSTIRASYTPFQMFSITSTIGVAGNLAVLGSLSKGAGAFDIQHPLNPAKRLVHSFIEGPRCDLLYRGRKRLQAGKAVVDIEKECTGNGSQLSPGTFQALATHPQVYLQNNDSFDFVRGTIDQNLLTIFCENSNSSATVDWMIMAERHDPFVKSWNRTDENGFLILEHPN